MVYILNKFDLHFHMKTQIFVLCKFHSNVFERTAERNIRIHIRFAMYTMYG